ncbi:MAG: hypothetical protein ABEH38_02655 [Flavobacteriales bacterium]
MLSAWIAGTLAFIFFFTTIGFLVWGLSSSKNTPFFYGLIPLGLFLASLAYALVSFFNTAFSYGEKVKEHIEGEVLKDRSGPVVYKDLFGEDDHGCVKVKRHQELSVPPMEQAVWMHLKTCPEEMSRITSEMDSGIVKRSKEEVKPIRNDWFDLRLEGDSVLFYEKVKGEGTENKEVLTIYSNEERTEAYCVRVKF